MHSSSSGVIEFAIVIDTWVVQWNLNKTVKKLCAQAGFDNAACAMELRWSRDQ